MPEDHIQDLKRKNESLTRELLAAYEELDLLHTLAGIFATSADVDEMGRRLVDEAVASLSARGGFLAYTGEGMEEFDPVLCGATQEEVQAFVHVAAPRILKGESFLEDQALAEGFDPRPMLVVPLRSRDGIFGALGLLRGPGSEPFTAGDDKALSVLATQAAGVIVQKRNLDLTYLSERLRRTNEGLQALFEISRELTATLDVNRVLAAMVNLLGKVVPHDRASISLKEGARWRLRAVSGLPTVDRGHADVRQLEGLHIWVGERGEPVELVLGSDPEPPELFRAALQRFGMESFHALPLADEEGMLGILALEQRDHTKMPEGVQEVLAVLANQATIALRNAQLYSQVPLIGLLAPFLERKRRFAHMSWPRRLAWMGGAALVAAALVLVPVPHRVGGAGVLVPTRVLNISAAVGGRVAEVPVREGEAVQAGQVLALLDDHQLRLERAEARARVERAGQRVRQLEAAREPAEAALERVRLERYRQEAELAGAALNETVLAAPRDGVVLTPRVHQRVGERLEAGEVFCTLAALDAMEAEVAVPERHAASIADGQTVELKLEAYPERTFTGTVIALRPMAEEREDRTVVVARVAIEDAGGTLRPGMQGRARIRVGEGSLGSHLLRRPARWLRSRFWF